MENIYSLVSDDKFIDEFIKWMRNREVDQKFLYQWDVASSYYENSLNSKSFSKTTEFICDFGNEKIIGKENEVAMISFWCWNSWVEYEFIKSAKEKKIHYYWVDSSSDMLKLSIEKMKNLECNKEFIQADFSTKSFKSEINQITSKHKNKVYVMFGNTFWNIKETNIIDILADILKKWDKLWVSVALRNGITEKDNFELLEDYEKVLKNNKIMGIYFNVLKKYWVTENDGEMWLFSSIEESIWWQKFNFYFEFSKKTEIEIRGNLVIFLPWERIFLQKIYEYDRKSFINFFEEHRFTFIDWNSKPWSFSKLGQFLFEKQ